VGAGAVALGLSTYKFVHRMPGELLYADFMRVMSNGGYDPLWVVARTERRLQELAKNERFDRQLRAPVLFAMAGISATTALLLLPRNAHDPMWGPKFDTAGLFGLLSVGSAAFAVSSLFPTPIERMVDLWKTDPGLKRLPHRGITSFSIIPIPHGFLGTVSGVF
jgi:hypothetical protein